MKITKNFIPYNKPFFALESLNFIKDAVSKKTIASDGFYTKKCQKFFADNFNFQYSFLTPSCTAALEMAALLANISEGDEVIVPSYTFTSTANAFVLRGAKIKFADSNIYNPNIDPSEIEKLITNKTKVIVIVHYAGIACDMKAIKLLTKKFGLLLIEDCAHSINSYLYGKPLGSYGDLSCFSFHDTKNISSGEGGLLVVNNKRFLKRAEIIREKGTNRAAFFRGEINKYSWVDIGSSFLCSEITSAYLYGQLCNFDKIQEKRVKIFECYYSNLKNKSSYKSGLFELPNIINLESRNGHIFYIVLKSRKVRDQLIIFLRENNIQAVSHYISLHKSKFYRKEHGSRPLRNSDKYTNCLLRLPLYPNLKLYEMNKITNLIEKFFEGQ
jgi:dTDP-4-amino-4,6-dideoxygalactose transaminase